MTEHSERKKSIKYKITHLYCDLKKRAIKKGIPYMSREDFVQFASTNKQLEDIFTQWVESNFSQKLTPTTDRIIPELGYIAGNIQFLTLSENVAKGNKESPRKGGNNKLPVILKKEGHIEYFQSSKDACDFLGVSRNKICLALKSDKTIKGWEVHCA